MTSREDLDGEMRSLLIAIGTCSHVPAVTYGGGAGSDEHPGGRRPPGDLGGERLARQYGHPFHTCTRNCKHRLARTDTERQRVVEETRAELKLIRGESFRVRPEGESQDKTIARMLKETVGWAPDDVEHSRWKMSARMVRRHRQRAGLHPETGADESAIAPDADRLQRVTEMAASGMTIRQIAAVLKVSHPTVVRDLRRSAA